MELFTYLANAIFEKKNDRHSFEDIGKDSFIRKDLMFSGMFARQQPYCQGSNSGVTILCDQAETAFRH